MPPAEVAELAQALAASWRMPRDPPRSMDRRLAFALHRLAFESQILHTDAWPGAFDAWTVDCSGRCRRPSSASSRGRTSAITPRPPLELSHRETDVLTWPDPATGPARSSATAASPRPSTRPETIDALCDRP